MKEPKQVELTWSQQYRIIPSVFPPINFFEDIVELEQMEKAWIIEGLTNDRLRDEAGDITRVRREDRVCGPGSSVVMAPFTHITYPSRFSDGSYGVYYAANSLETAIRETVYHRERFLTYTREAPGNIDMRAYVGKVLKPLIDIRPKVFSDLHHPDNYNLSQQFGITQKEKHAWGIVYNSVRHNKGQCVAALRPTAITIPQQAQHLSYTWSGKSITAVKKLELLFDF